MDTPHFVATPWRGSDELIELRRWFYDREGTDERRKGVDRVLAWRVRKPELPLFLDSTADIVDAVLQDESGKVEHNALRLVYAAAVSRFVTGFTDTQLDLRRSRPSWLLPDPTTPFLDFPRDLLETRHNVVHRQLPPLSNLTKAAQHSLRWLWEWYWSNLDVALSTPLTHSKKNRGKGVRKGEKAKGGVESYGEDGDASGSLRDKISGVLKKYMRERKGELKSQATSTTTTTAVETPPIPTPSTTAKKSKKPSKTASIAADSALSSLLALSPLLSATQTIILDILITDRLILPKQFTSISSTGSTNTTMSGAFLLWTPFLVRLSTASPTFLTSVLNALLSTFKGQKNGDGGDDAIIGAMCEWTIHILTGSAFKKLNGRDKLVEKALGECFTGATSAYLRVAEGVLGRKKDVPNRELYAALLEAAREDEQLVEKSSSPSPPQTQAEATTQREELLEVQQLQEQKEKDEGDMDVDMAEQQLVSESSKSNSEDMDIDMAEQQLVSEARTEEQRSEEKQRGPRTYVGLWRPVPIGTLPAGWEVDSVA